MAKPYYEIATPLHQNELYLHLFLHQSVGGANGNQNIVVNPNKHIGFGVIVTNNWAITEDTASNSKIVARAQGMHMQTGMVKHSWYTSFNMVFEDDRFKGSTLQVMGLFSDRNETQLSITGGTGEFALARGIIKQKVVQRAASENHRELHIRAFYTPMNTSLVPGATNGNSWTLGA